MAAWSTGLVQSLCPVAFGTGLGGAHTAQNVPIPATPAPGALQVAAPRTAGQSPQVQPPGMGSLWFSPELTRPFPRAGTPFQGRPLLPAARLGADSLPTWLHSSPFPFLGSEALVPGTTAPQDLSAIAPKSPSHGEGGVQACKSCMCLSGWGTAQQGAAFFPGERTAGEQGQKSTLLFP